jgi:hypothetical protein
MLYRTRALRLVVLLALLTALVLLAGCSCSLQQIASGTCKSIPYPDPPGPTPPAPVPPPDPVPSDPRDAIPIDQVVWHDPSPVGYAVTATLSGVTISAPGGTTGPITVCWDWSRPAWPTNGEPKPSDGNLWIIARLADGRYHGGTWEMTAPKFLPHQCRTTEAHDGQPPFIQSDGPTAQWIPARGDQVCHLITTITRGGVPGNSPHERTPIVCGVWP